MGTRAAAQAAKGMARAAKTSCIQILICQDREPKSDNCPFFTGGIGQLDIPTKGAVGMIAAGGADASRENGRGRGSAAPSGDRSGKWPAGDKIT